MTNSTSVQIDMSAILSQIRQARLGVTENKARPILGEPTPQSSQTVPQIGPYSYDAHQILLNAHEAMLKLPSDLDYSQAAAIYGSQMAERLTSELKLDRALESILAQIVNIKSLVHDL
jgi:hypothetical protein